MSFGYKSPLSVAIQQEPSACLWCHPIRLCGAQAWNSLRGRETVALARELLGGNGVVSDFLVAKMFCDMEAIYTCAPERS